MSNIKLYRIDGIKLSNGKQAYGSYEMSIWLPVFTRYMREVHKVTLVWTKIADEKATAVSASTHVGGYAGDSRTWSLSTAKQRLVVHEGTRFGYVNCIRTKKQGFTPHNHGMLDVGYRTNCSYQIDAVRRGRDGLRGNGPDLDKAHRPTGTWMGWKQGVAAMLHVLEPPKPTTPPRHSVDQPKSAIPRYYTRKPWMEIPVDGVRSGLFWSRVQWQLNIKPTGVLDHYTVRALKVWLDPTGNGGGGDDGSGVLRPIDVRLLQSRIGATRDGVWGDQTTRLFQRYLNTHR